MIGGHEIQIPTTASQAPLAAAVGAIGQQWPEAVFENGITGERYAGFGSIPFAKTDEVFVYRDSHSADVWEAEGAVPAALNTMIHVIVDQASLTLVIDEPDRAMDSIVAAVKLALANMQKPSAAGNILEPGAFGSLRQPVVPPLHEQSS